MFNKLKKALKFLVDSVSQKTITEKDLEDILFDWQLKLIECDVAYPVADFIIDEVKKFLVGLKIDRFKGNLSLLVRDKLKDIFINMIEEAGDLDLLEFIRKKQRDNEPTKIVFVGVNGSGKTTTIAKIAYMLKRKNLLSVLACSDTFRAGAEEQLAFHAEKLGLRMIKHTYGADPAAVAYDAVSFASSRNIPVVLIDTAGRMQTDKGLMDELKKIIRVIDADLVIFVGDALAGNDALTQAEIFNEEVGIDASIITKIDADVKGGTAISILYATKKPIIYLGNGQRYTDLIRFTPNWLISSLLE